MLGHRNARCSCLIRERPKTRWARSRRTMRANLEKFDELCAKLVVIGMLHHFLAKARAGKIDLDDLANAGRRPIGHANDPIAEKERFIDVMVTIMAVIRSRRQRLIRTPEAHIA